MIIREVVKFVAIAIAAISLAGNLQAQEADTIWISYQGKLTDSNGDPLPAGTYTVDFRFYEDSTSAEPLWEQSMDIQINEGSEGLIDGLLLYEMTSYAVGDIGMSSQNLDPPWLGVRVEEEEVLPRTRITSAPHAFISRRMYGDITTSPGIIEIYNADDCVPPDPCGPAIELVASTDTSKFVLHPPDPCVPPEPCLTAVDIIATTQNYGININIPPPDDGLPPPDDSKPGIRLNSVDTSSAIIINRPYPTTGGPPPDDGIPAVELSSVTSGNSIIVNKPPPDDSQPPPDDNQQGIVLSTADVANSLQISPPPDDSRPVINLTAEETGNSITIHMPPPDDNLPGIKLNTVETSSAIIINRPPPDDGMPPPDDGIPAVELSSVTSGNSIVINKPPPDDGVPPPDDNLPGIVLSTTEAINSLQIIPPPDDSQPVIELLAEPTGNSITVNGPPPDDSKPGLRMTADGTANTITINLPPPDDNMPGITMAADPDMTLLNIDWGVPPDDSKPAFDVTADYLSEVVSCQLSAPSNDNLPEVSFNVDVANMESGFNMKPPPDDNQPAIAMNVNAIDNEGWLSLTNYDALGSAPGMVMSSSSSHSLMTAGWFTPPPDDNIPPPDDNKPMAQISNSVTTGSILVAGPSGADSEPSQVEIEADNTQAQIILSSETSVGALVPLVMTTNQNSASVGIGTESPGEELYVVGDITATGAITELSSKKYKTDINQISDAMEKVKDIRGVNFKWRTEEYPEMKFTEDQQVGLIAEEVEKVIPQLVHADNHGEMSVDYSKLTAVLIEAVKDQQEQIEELSKRVQELEGTRIPGR